MRDRSLDVAVTGMSARFPGAASIPEWWTALLAGRVLTRRYDRRELLDAGVDGDLLDDPDYVPVHGHLSGADRFDHTAFRLSPREAEMLDPQHRLMLETAWSALEDAAVPIGDSTTTAVFASASSSGYLRRMLENGALDPLTLEDALHGTGPDFLAGLISYRLGLSGPAVSVQTACSSSLVAVHLAVQALLGGDCDQAVVVAAGVPFPQAGYLHLAGGIHSPSGRCLPFDERADGVVAGSGVAAVVLRRLSDAPASGPPPYGVIIGSAVNNDGHAKAGFYAPSPQGQEAVIRGALRAACVGAGDLGYLEAHATGTRIGDPIEWSATSAALRAMGAAPGQVPVGALKANVGHLDNAAGIASLIKALLVVREGLIPPVAGFTRLNSLLETSGSPLRVPTAVSAWTGPQPRRAGINSFGIGGTNAHVIVEQPPPVAAGKPAPSGRPALLLLSAADPDALSRSATRLADHLTAVGPDPRDAAHTLAVGRVPLAERFAVAGRTVAELASGLGDPARRVAGRRPVSGPPPVLFVFPGQGAQRPGMAAPLAAALPGFAERLDACLAAFAAPLAAVLRRALTDRDFPAGELEETELAQPALFAVGYAAATALVDLGVTPAAAVGHSLGEITAACVSGVLDLPDAARFVTARGQAMQACPPGAMLAVACSARQALRLVGELGVELELASDNAPESCVLSGRVEAVEAFRRGLGDRVYAKRLPVNRGFHSREMRQALVPLREVLAAGAFRPTVLPVASTATGEIVPVGGELPRWHFVDQVTGVVRFADALAELAKAFPGVVGVEIGPGRTMSSAVEAAGIAGVALASGRTGRPDEEVLTALGRLWCLGGDVDVAALVGDGARVHLPTYPFAGEAWLAPEAAPRGRGPRPKPARERGAGTCAGEPEEVLEQTSTVEAEPEEVMADLWRELLGRADLTEDSDFFALGGDSLSITHLARRIALRFDVQVPVRSMLAGRTLGRQTALLKDAIEGARESPVGQLGN